MTFPEFSIIWVDLVLGLLNTSRFTYANAVIRSKVFDSYAESQISWRLMYGWMTKTSARDVNLRSGIERALLGDLENCLSLPPRFQLRLGRKCGISGGLFLIEGRCPATKGPCSNRSGSRLCRE